MRRAPLVLILLLYLLITIGYGIANPLFEAPDEHSHYFTAQYIADNRRLPVVEADYDEWMGQEAAQPPLYYLLGAPIVAAVGAVGAREQVWLNPFASIGDASALNNLNWVVHTPAEDWPWTGFALAAHLLRLVSTLFGLGTLLCIYAAGRLLWPDDTVPALLATALVAFLPQFNFIHATITNDTLITLLASATLVQLLDLWRRSGRGEAWPWTRLALLGLTIGLAALSKTAGILLLVYSLVFLAVVAWGDGHLRRLAPALALAGGLAVVVAGWLWLRNASLYGDPTAANQFIRLAGGDRNASVVKVLGETDGLLVSLVAVFGWFSLRAPDWVYWVWGAIVALALIGALACLVGWARSAREKSSDPAGRQSSRRTTPLWLVALMLAGWLVLVYAGLFSFMLRTEAAQGRLLFPAILPIALGVAWGLVGSGGCAARRLQRTVRRFAAVPVLLALATTLACLVLVVQPSYARPPVVDGIPADATRVLPQLIDRGQGLSLLAARSETDAARPGEVVWLTLYWRADVPAAPASDGGETGEEAPPPELVIEVFGRDGERIANLHGYHGRGQYPATLWSPGAIIADRFPLRVDPATRAPVLARVFARLADGLPGIEVATVKVVPAAWPVAPETTLAELGDHIALAGTVISPPTAQPGETVIVNVRWYVPRGVPGTDYTTLVHLGQPDRVPLVTGDQPPLSGAYPTRAWQVGETIEDAYRLTLPDDLPRGRYPIWIGMYDPATGERLAATVDGEPQPNNVVLAGWVDVACAPGDTGCDE